MSIYRSKRQLRSKGFRKNIVSLAIEPLEQRTLLASLTSRLPPITVTPGSEPVQIRQLTDPAQEITVPSAVVTALNNLAMLQDMYADTNQLPNDESMLAELQQESWMPVSAVLETEAFEPLDLEAAIEIATNGFQVNLPPVETAIQRIFGDALTDTTPASHAKPSSDPAGVTEDPPSQPATAIETPETSKSPPNVSKADREQEPKNAPESNTRGNPERASNGQLSENKPRDVEAAQLRVVIDQSHLQEHDERQDDRQSPINDMVVLPQPSAIERNPSRIDRESPSNFGNGERRREASEFETLLGQMVLLPMTQDTGMEHQIVAPTVLAGFNPVAMLQIFIGTELGGLFHEPLDVATDGAVNVGEQASVSSILLRGDRVAAVVLVVAVGYWYVNSREDASLAMYIPAKLRDRRPSRWIRLLEFFRQIVKRLSHYSHQGR